MAEAVCGRPGFKYRGNMQVFREVCKEVEEREHIVVEGDLPKQKGRYTVKVSANGQKQTIIGHWEPQKQDFMTEESIYFSDLLLIPLEWRPI